MQLRGFTLVRLLGGVFALAALTACTLVFVQPARARAQGANDGIIMGGGPVSFTARDLSTGQVSGRARCAIYLPAVQDNTSPVQLDGFFDVFAEFETAAGHQRVKVRFFWDRASARSNMTTIDIVQTQDGFTWTVDREPPTFVRLNGLPPGEPWIGTLCPVVRVRGLRPGDLDPCATLRVGNIGSSGQDGVSVDLAIKNKK